MGIYTTVPVDEKTLKDIIESIKSGYTDNKGIRHKPNEQVATILTLQANLGCRIGDICALKVENIVWDGNAWRLDLTEQKTGKKRLFIVPTPVKKFIDKWMKKHNIESGELFSINEYAVWKQMRGVCSYLGLEETSCHSLRKYFCHKIYESSGKDIALTSQSMLHSSPAVTYRYLQMSSKQIDDVLSKNVSLV